MITRIKINKDFATVIIMRELSYGEKITSKKKFLLTINVYVGLFGHSCYDDHEYESEPYREKAEVIVDKYYSE